MEKYSNKEVSNSDKAPGENAEDQELYRMEMELRSKNRSLLELLSKTQEELYMNKKTLTYFEDLFLHDKISQFQTSPLECSLSPIGSPIHKSQNLSEETFENLSDSTILEISLRQPDIVSCDPIEALEKQFKLISNRFQSFEAIMETQIKFLSNSPQKTSDNETQASGPYTESDTRYKTLPDLETIETNVGSGRYFVGKGKEAANPTYRYQKRSKTNVSTCKSLAKDSPVKLPEEAYITTESKTLDLQSSKVELTRIYPAMKRKGSDSSERDHDRWHLDESCDRTSLISKLSGNRADDDDLKIAKKLKFEDVEKVSRQYPTLTALPSQKNYESIDLTEFMNQPQIDQTSYEREQLILPSASGLSNAVGCISNSEESSLANESEDVLLSEIGESSLASRSEDVLLSEIGESSLTSVSDLSPGERGESSLTSVSEDTPLSGNGESQHFQS